MKRLKLFLNITLVLLVFIGFTIIGFAEASNTDLINDTNKLTHNLGTLQSQFRSIKSNLEKPRIIVDLPSNIASALKSLHGALGLAEERMKSISIVPSWRTKMEKLITSCHNLRDKVEKGKQTATTIDIEIKPVRKVIDTLYYISAAMDLSIPTAIKALQEHLDAVKNTQDCINNLSDIHKKSLQEGLNGYIDASDTIIKAASGDIDVLEANVDKINKQIKVIIDPLNNNSKTLTDLEHLVSKMNTDVRALLSPLRDVEWVLEQKVTISIPYPNPKTLGTTTSHVSVSISVNTIIKDVNAIEHEIEKYIGNVIFAILKKVGLDEYVKDFLNKGNEWVDSALGRLHINVDFEIPGMDDLENKLESLKKSFDDLGKLDTKLNEGSVDNIHNNMSDSTKNINGVKSDCSKIKK